MRNFLNENGFGYYAEATAAMHWIVHIGIANHCEAFRMNGFEDIETVLAMSQERTATAEIDVAAHIAQTWIN